MCAECTYSVHSIPPWPTTFVIGRTDEALSAAFALVFSQSILSIFPGTQAKLGVLYSSIRVTLQVAFIRTWRHSNELAFHWDHRLKVALKSVTVAAFVTNIENCSLVLCGKSFSLSFVSSFAAVACFYKLICFKYPCFWDPSKFYLYSLL